MFSDNRLSADAQQQFSALLRLRLLHLNYEHWDVTETVAYVLRPTDLKVTHFSMAVQGTKGLFT